MLHAVIHAGLHKTGTTSFQHSCSDASRELLNAGIHYPKGKKPHHNHYASLTNTDWVRTLSRKTKKLIQNGYLLISAENFEYRFHHDYPAKIEETLYKSGVKYITWVLCFRDPFSSYCSLYSQLSYPKKNKNDAYPILEFAASGRLAAAKGYLDFQTNRLEQRFYFDYPSLINNLRDTLNGQVLGIDFDHFTKHSKTPGDLLIQSMSNDGRSLSDCIEKASYHGNTSLSKDVIERNYLRRFFAITKKDLPPWLQDAAQVRLQSRIEQEAQIQALFQQNFGHWKGCLNTPDDVSKQLKHPRRRRRFFI